MRKLLEVDEADGDVRLRDLMISNSEEPGIDPV